MRPRRPRPSSSVTQLEAGPRAPRGARLIDAVFHRLLQRLDPERAHSLALAALRLTQALRPLRTALERRYRLDEPRLGQQLLGLEFGSPVGLAAGYDKNAVVIGALPALGFGFLEVGTVTPLAQPGNPRPRLFRYPAARSLENRMGFNNQGMEAVGRRLARGWPAAVPVGVNLGKNRATPQDGAHADYAALLAHFACWCDYLVINVSSPNTPRLRELESRQSLGWLVGTGRRLAARPLLVKLSPDLEPDRAVELAEAAVDAGAAGVVLTNTTTDYSLLPGARAVGGLSGAVLRERSFALLQAVAGELFGRCLLISVGGVDSAAEAYRRLRAGASLVQIYTALVFEGPGLVRRINEGLVGLLDRDRLAGIGEAVGADLRQAAPAGAGADGG